MSTHLADLFVEAVAPTTASLHACKDLLPEVLDDGQVLVHIAKLVVTANTLTYGIAGKHPVLKYFANFPVSADVPEAARYGRTPCWGTGVIVKSACSDIAVGTRIHGLFPISPYAVLTPTKITESQFTDGVEHRAGLLTPYLEYKFHDSGPFRGLSYDEEDWQMGAGNLFSTGWSMSQTAVVHPSKPTSLLLTSASSRTSMAAAFAAKFHAIPLEVIGVTSVANADFVRKSGFYDIVCVYDDVASLSKQKVAVLDVAGNAGLKESLYKKFGDDLVYWGGVGITNVQTLGQKVSLEGLGGSPPTQFLVFSAIEEVSKAYGAKEVAEMLSASSAAYKKQTFSSFKAVRKFGPEDTLQLYNDMVHSKTDPSCSYICSLWPEDLHEPSIVGSKL